MSSSESESEAKKSRIEDTEDTEFETQINLFSYKNMVFGDTQRCLLFLNTYTADPSKAISQSRNDKFFKKNSDQLSREEKEIFLEYFEALVKREKEMESLQAKREEYFHVRNVKRAYDHFISDHDEHLKPHTKAVADLLKNSEIKINNKIFQPLLSKAKDEIKYFTFDESKIFEDFIRSFDIGPERTEYLFNEFGLQLKYQPQVIHVPSVGPSLMTGLVQVEAQEENRNLIYAFPIEIKTHFPILLCHPVFPEFMNIINADLKLNSSNTFSSCVKDYLEHFHKKSHDSLLSIEDAVYYLITTFLVDPKASKYSYVDDPKNAFINDIQRYLKKLFPARGVVKSQVKIEGADDKIKIDLGVFVDNFPFIIFQCNHMNFSLNSVLKAIQTYARCDGSGTEFIDNNPCFLMVVDLGILFVYGVVIVNNRVMSDCLLTLEFTNYYYNLNGFLDKFYRCITSLIYFHQRFTQRIKNGRQNDDVPKIPELRQEQPEQVMFTAFDEEQNQKQANEESNVSDQEEVEASNEYSEFKESIEIDQHTQYSKFKTQPTTVDFLPWPAIFDIEAWSDDRDLTSSTTTSKTSQRINITYMNEHFGKKVFRVKYNTGLEQEGDEEKVGVLKIAQDYGIDAHARLAKKGMAPRIIGYESIAGIHVILMECVNMKKFATLHEYIYVFLHKKYCEYIIQSLQEFLDKIHNEGIVHGDFRPNNIFVTDILIETDSDSDSDQEASGSGGKVDAEIQESKPGFKYVFLMFDFEMSGDIGSLYPILLYRNRIDIKWSPGYQTYRPRAFEHDQFMLNQIKQIMISNAH